MVRKVRRERRGGEREERKKGEEGIVERGENREGEPERIYKDGRMKREKREVKGGREEGREEEKADGFYCSNL